MPRPLLQSLQGFFLRFSETETTTLMAPFQSAFLPLPSSFYFLLPPPNIQFICPNSKIKRGIGSEGKILQTDSSLLRPPPPFPPPQIKTKQQQNQSRNDPAKLTVELIASQPMDTPKSPGEEPGRRRWTDGRTDGRRPEEAGGGGKRLG